MTREELNNWFRDYCETSGATCVRLGFKLVDTVYYIDLTELWPEMVKLDRESTSNGSKLKLRLQLNNLLRVKLVEECGAVEVGSYEKIFGNCKNDGDRWEQYWCEQNGITRLDAVGAGEPNKEYGVRDFKLRMAGELHEFGRFIRIQAKTRYRLGVWVINLL